MTFGIMQNVGFFSYILVGLFGVIILLSAGVELYRVYVKKQDRQFWSGVSFLFVMFFCAVGFQFSMDSLNKYHLESSLTGENLTLSGSLGYEALLKEFDLSEQYGCVVDDTHESKQCMFLMMFKSSEERFANFVSTDKRSIVRYGVWPNDRSFEFPAFKLNN